MCKTDKSKSQAPKTFLVNMMVSEYKPGDPVALRDGELMRVLRMSDDMIVFVQHLPSAKEETRVQMKLKPLAINL